MASRAAVAAALLVSIGILVSVFIVIVPSIQSGTFSIGLPKGANLVGQAPISVSQISLSSGGKIQNQYLINTYWDVTLSVHGLTNTAFLKFGPGNASAQVSLGNGGTATPQSQIYVTLSPGTPYATVALKPIQVTWAPAASGWGIRAKVFSAAQLSNSRVASSTPIIPIQHSQRPFTFQRSSTGLSTIR